MPPSSGPKESLVSRVFKLEHWAWGVNRDNGLNSEVKRLARDMDDMKKTIWKATGAMILANVIVVPLAVGVAVALLVKHLG